MGHPSVYPTGVTVYKPEKCWNGYNLVPTINKGALLFDMNGNEVRRWDQFHGFPNKLLPGGYLMGHSGDRDPDYGMQDGVDLVQIDYDGNIVWKFKEFEYIDDEGNEPQWMARQHHDYQRTGNPVGYYAPGMEPEVDGGNTLILAHTDLYNEKISDKRLHDDVMYEVDWEGNIIWQWKASDHFEEFGFSEQAKNVLARDPNMRDADGGVGDWLHINSMSYLGPNKWYDQGDERFKPDNIIWDSREANIMAIIDKETGEIVWQLGPDWNDERTKHIGYLIGMHHAHMIPRGLPGEGNILVFDNGGWAGYGFPNPSSKFGQKNAWRDYSRILEINPITLEIEWSFTPPDINAGLPFDAYKFYSPYVSSAQRLPNGNTLIDEGSDGRMIEVTENKEIVWEWISPYYEDSDTLGNTNMIYRGYRYPYSWVPQEENPEEIAIEAKDVTTFRMPNAGEFGAETVVEVEGTLPYERGDSLCIASKDDEADTETDEEDKLFSIDTEVFTPVEENNFENIVLNSKKPALVLFGAERCTHCKALHPLLEDAVTEEFSGQLNVCYVDVDQNPKLVDKYDTAKIPVVAIFKNGEEKDRIRGEQDYDDLAIFIENNIE
jgi:thiol-disulfide isomerase/thioredoxin